MRFNILYSVRPLISFLASCGTGNSDSQALTPAPVTQLVTSLTSAEVPNTTLEVSVLYDSIPRLQIQRVLNTANANDQPSNNRSLYLVNDNSDVTPIYQSTSWPYISAEVATDITKDAVITAQINLYTDGCIINSGKPLFSHP